MQISSSQIIKCMQDLYDCDPGVYEGKFFENTVLERFEAFGIQEPEDYIRILHQNAGEARYLQALLLNSHSEFFRNSLTFSILEQFVIPQLLSSEQEDSGCEVRIWSAGCAAGQEPCSVGILIADFLHQKKRRYPYRIFGTDQVESELEKARRGIYTLTSLQNTKLSFINHWFKQSGHDYQISEEIRQKIDYSNYNLLDKKSDAPPVSIFGNFDMVLCCNVLYYFKPEIRRRLLNKFSRSLKKGGFFITSEAETDFVQKSGLFKQYMLPAPVFVRI